METKSEASSGSKEAVDAESRHNAHIEGARLWYRFLKMLEDVGALRTTSRRCLMRKKIHIVICVSLLMTMVGAVEMVLSPPDKTLILVAPGFIVVASMMSFHGGNPITTMVFILAATFVIYCGVIWAISSLGSLLVSGRHKT
jgi:hypothetical protein